MKLEADFSAISSSTEPLAKDTTYRFKLTRIEDQGEDQEWKSKHATDGMNPALIFVSEVVEGERLGAELFDYVYIKTKDGKTSKRGLGRIKAYAEAILGKEAANSTAGINTDELINGEFDGFVEHEKYEDKTTKEEKTSVKITKILPRA